jgi:hypothetical protein
MNFASSGQATTKRKRETFFWFFDSFFLECASGASVWNNSKTKQLVSEARDPSGSKVVSVSDEAFALILIKNFLVKWKPGADEEVAAFIGPVGDVAAATTEGENKNRRKQTKKPVNALEKCKDSVHGVAGVLRASNSSIS